MKKLIVVLALLLGGCVVAPAPAYVGPVYPTYMGPTPYYTPYYAPAPYYYGAPSVGLQFNFGGHGRGRR
jgi:hypothetical protein